MGKFYFYVHIRITVHLVDQISLDVLSGRGDAMWHTLVGRLTNAEMWDRDESRLRCEHDECDWCVMRRAEDSSTSQDPTLHGR